ncbi:glutamyl-tRNA reductase [Acidimicrobiia bacterium EGI L10123]|uniref:glutamyl-tRNA reductase n=1 Tax=Salinilacustrithrix flava TaxID=2957203 RepID=UPI003D7C30D7|nr:glutamyl-tRNA reductase [Acidimicrobiia bacterium EGI L10123]
MPVVVIGVNHRTAPLGVLEAMTVGDAALGKTLHALLTKEHVSEAVVLSTCNRTEVYAVAEKFHGGYADVRAVLAELAFLDPEDFADHLYVHHDTAAVAHLFDVVSGLDSAVLGEHEIQGQVKTSWEKAQREDAAGTTLNLLFRHALEAGKRARSETGIGQGTASVSYAAVALAAQQLGSLDGRRAIVLGAGEMGSSMAESLASAGVAELVVANRTHDKAKALAAAVGGRAIRFTDLGSELVDADVVLTSTGAASVLLTRDDVEAAMVARGGQPLVLVDIAVPRDIEPSVADVAGVTVLDMDDLGAFADRGLAERRREVDAVRSILDEELERYRSATSAREIAPVIVALREGAEALRTAELERARARLADLDDAQIAAVEKLTQGLVAKLLHQPTVALREAAGTTKGDRLVQALRDLYDIDS